MDADPLDASLAPLVGSRTAGVIEKAFGYRTVGELLGHYPRRYATRGELTELSRLPMGESVTIVAEVREVRERPMRNRRGTLLEVVISDGTGTLSLTFFGQSWRAATLRRGVRGMFAGTVSMFRDTPQLTHPDYRLFDDEEAATEADGGAALAKDWAELPIPIYPATRAISSWKLQAAIGVLLDGLREVPDPMPEVIRAGRSLLPLGEALELIHRPQREGEQAQARETLRFHEAFLLQLALLERRIAARSTPATPRLPLPGGLLERFDSALPFALTGDQRVVGHEIAADLAAPNPLSRLVQGEVGSGKTLVALRAMLTVAESGGQAVLLAPTEVLAAQHLRSIVRTVGPDLATELVPTLLTGGLGAAERRSALLRIVSGNAKIVVGTHALLGDAVSFYDLALVVIDEQHRFGVDQRDVLRRKGATPPHVLVLTATPIPRTVAMTVFGDLDTSTLRELPAGRPGITSHVVALADHPGWIARVWERAEEEIRAGHQVYLVCPAIEPGEVADGTAAEDGPTLTTVATTHDGVRAHPLLGARRSAALHGRMTTEEKDEIMRAFAAGEIDVLVSTTVIEVGIDVPNASMMVVLDAERFGISQLHQLRGRIGRGGVPGVCLFVTAAEAGTTARERVEAVAATLDGFKLAEIDLELRREGDVLGDSQSGDRSSLRLLSVVQDAPLILEARVHAEQLLERDPALVRHDRLRAALARRVQERDREFLAKS
ncbi:ATP-dependent DNA helicase RecG [Rathayibacter toxicus]|uniref:Probable DNA 3'-5' helicase RecG n=1 Tax=Rathayibacter toxicus TaxID=145458 RepID=A0A2S5Y5W6_9MICO|nr:ATP-dependent DNA helicase RecG [Rathayibacter toxicus]PPH22553.1 ATP-dependent DNA helicase RecG [Rathayibacter toxicus]PPH56753.1 ATP-dependent DNA helicase RecG [Rathayibacter toxicus]PPH59447.1 ATP-dependent DNA helicase RecG [Rathayibacter toxicus]PPH86677.1 ATP-dependent DNA helicase RecG [Rathayibacter toxicus]PPI14394.1 ATP-dependent DNA helicase RecG [Rathayibacter toxicus]